MRFLAVAATALLLPVAALAQSNDGPAAQVAQAEVGDAAVIGEFLAAFDGTWSGRGTTRNSLDSDLEAAACGLQAWYEPDPIALVTSGECATATAQQRIALDGRMEVAADGTVTGGFFSGFQTAVLLESETRFYDTYFELDVAYEVTLDGELRRIDMVVSVGRPVDNRFRLILEVLNPDTGALVEFTRMDFSKVGGG